MSQGCGHCQVWVQEQYTVGTQPGGQIYAVGKSVEEKKAQGKEALQDRQRISEKDPNSTEKGAELQQMVLHEIKSLLCGKRNC